MPKTKDKTNDDIEIEDTEGVEAIDFLHHAEKLLIESGQILDAIHSKFLLPLDQPGFTTLVGFCVWLTTYEASKMKLKSKYMNNSFVESQAFTELISTLESIKVNSTNLFEISHVTIDSFRDSLKSLFKTLPFATKNYFIRGVKVPEDKKNDEGGEMSIIEWSPYEIFVSESSPDQKLISLDLLPKEEKLDKLLRINKFCEVKLKEISEHFAVLTQKGKMIRNYVIPDLEKSIPSLMKNPKDLKKAKMLTEEVKKISLDLESKFYLKHYFDEIEESIKTSFNYVHVHEKWPIHIEKVKRRKKLLRIFKRNKRKDKIRQEFRIASLKYGPILLDKEQIFLGSLILSIKY